MHLRWIEGIIATNKKNAPWFVDPSMQITKASLIFASKAWWTLRLYQLSLTIGENILTLDRVTFVAGLMESYYIYIAKIIMCEN